MFSRTCVVSLLFCVAVLHEAGGAEDQGPRPADLVDLERIQNMDLIELGWHEESREQLDDVLVLGGSWKGPHFVGYDANLQEAELDLTEYAKVYMPLHPPPGSDVHQVVWAAHTAPNAATTFPGCIDLAGELPVAFVLHGEKSQDWTSLGFTSRDAMTAITFLAMQLLNLCEPHDYVTANYGLALAETQMMALTLLSRLIEAEGYKPANAAMKGLSKEGFSTWLASAVDDRLLAAAPGGFPSDSRFRPWCSARSGGMEGAGAPHGVWSHAGCMNSHSERGFGEGGNEGDIG